MNDFITNLFGGSLPEIKTDVGSDIDAALKANGMRLGIIMFIAVLLAFVIGSVISKKIAK